MSDGGGDSSQDLHLAGYSYARLFNEVDSTMNVARSLVSSQQGSGPGAALVMARKQTSGRGTQGRIWEGDTSSFFGTFVFQRPLPVAAMSGYSLAVGVWIAAALASLGAALRLKWPNDLVLVAKGGGGILKLGGILIEVLDNSPAAVVLVGVGINLLGSPASVPHSSSLREAFGVTLTQEQAAETLGKELLAGHREFMENGSFAPWVSRWSALSCFEREFITMEVGATTVVGEYAGVSSSGAIRLRSGEVMREVPSGHIIGWS